jgi:hypothetical protein
MALSSMYSPGLDCGEVDPQPAANSSEAAMRTAKNRLGEAMIDLQMVGRLLCSTTG